MHHALIAAEPNVWGTTQKFDLKSNYVDTYRAQDGLKCDHYRRYTASNSEPIFHGQQPEIRTMTSFFYVLEPDADEQLK